MRLCAVSGLPVAFFPLTRWYMKSICSTSALSGREVKNVKYVYFSISSVVHPTACIVRSSLRKSDAFRSYIRRNSFTSTVLTNLISLRL